VVEVIPLAEEEKDPIIPTLIEHRVDSGVHERTREVLYHYNYFYYRFDADAGEIWARSYVDEIQKVSLYLPQGVDLEHTDVRRVLGYLTRRFQRVEMLGEAGYVAIWPKHDSTPRNVAS
jgi:hypothetical protein